MNIIMAAPFSGGKKKPFTDTWLKYTKMGICLGWGNLVECA